MEPDIMTDTAKASVIIPTKNPGPIFPRVLEAVCRQITDFPFEVLVIDSGSTDGTVQFVRNLADPRVRLHEIPPSEFGHGKTRNAAIALTHGEYAVLITHDAMPATDGWLSAMVAVADTDPKIAGVFGRHLAYPEANPYTIRDLDRHFQNFVPHPVVWLDDRGRYDHDQSYRQQLHFFSDNNALIRRSVWNQLPYPDVDFAEDQIWAQKAIEAGWKKGYSHEGAVFHSHDFPIFETMQRSFDESYALYRLFGYVLTPGLIRMLLTALRQTRDDLAYARSKGIWRTQPAVVLQMPMKNLARSVGHFLGSRAEKLPRKLRHWLSRDRRMLLGLPTSTGN